MIGNLLEYQLIKYNFCKKFWGVALAFQAQIPTFYE